YFILNLLSRWYLNISRPQGRRENWKLLIQNPKMKEGNRPTPVFVLDFHTLGICNHYPWHVRSLPFDSSKEAHRKFLEKNLTDEATEIDDLNIKLIIKALPKVAQSGEKNTELVVVRQDQPLKILSPEETEEENEKQTKTKQTKKPTEFNIMVNDA
uniref:Uncharacterized protein n=1 Tax=Anser brachyrhynchus TaxID=132585 RepID=A0A8B9BV16_9AVES